MGQLLLAGPEGLELVEGDHTTLEEELAQPLLSVHPVIIAQRAESWPPWGVEA